MRGVDVCGETTLVVTSSTQLFDWEEFGLKLHIRDGTLPPGTNECTIRIKASTSGQYQFPKGFHLVSAVFWLHCEPMCKFAKAITMEMEHCAKLENAKKLTFMRAVCSQETLPYAFKKIGGTFSEVKYWGAIELNGFSLEAIAKEGGNEENQLGQQSSQQDIVYSAIMFHTSHQRVKTYVYDIDFVVTWNTKTHITVSLLKLFSHSLTHPSYPPPTQAVKKEYKNAERDYDKMFEFESDRITIDIPEEGIVTGGGWKLKPVSNPVVSGSI